MAYLAVLTLSAGRRAGWSAIAGIALGLACVGLLAAFGFAALVSSSLWLSRALVVAGFFYLLWLAVDTWRVPSAAQPMEENAVVRHAFTRGLVTNLLNPKAFLFYVAVLPGFIMGGVPQLDQALLLTGVSVAIASAVHTIIVLLASRAAPYLLKSQHQDVARRAMALLLVVIAVWFAASNLHRS